VEFEELIIQEINLANQKRKEVAVHAYLKYERYAIDCLRIG
jgi:hypothetical protein